MGLGLGLGLGLGFGVGRMRAWWIACARRRAAALG